MYQQSCILFRHRLFRLSRFSLLDEDNAIGVRLALVRVFVQMPAKPNACEMPMLSLLLPLLLLLLPLLLLP